MRPFVRFATTLILFAIAGTLAAEPGTTPPWHFLSLDDVDAGHFVHHSYTSVALDDAGKVHVGYRGPGRVAKYISNRTGAWIPETVFSGQGVPVARESSLAIDSNGLPHISFSYSDGSAEDLKYARKLADGTWEVTTVFTTNSGGMENAIALDAGDKAHISHWQWNGSDLLYSTDINGSWSTATLDDANWDRTALEIDSHDQAHIVYRNGAKLIHFHGGVFETIDSSVSGKAGPALAIDAQDGLHVTYSSGLTLKYATNKSGAWSVTTIAPGADVGLHHAVAADPQGNAHISYRSGPRDLSSMPPIRPAHGLRWLSTAAPSWATRIRSQSVGTAERPSVIDTRLPPRISSAGSGGARHRMSGLWETVEGFFVTMELRWSP